MRRRSSLRTSNADCTDGIFCNGAEACAKDGVLEGVGSAFGLHLWNQLPVGRIGVNRGALLAAVDEFSIEVEGRGGHGAAPHETADPIVAAVVHVKTPAAIAQSAKEAKLPASVSLPDSIRCAITG